MDFDTLISGAEGELRAAEVARDNYKTEQETIARSAGSESLTAEQKARIEELRSLKSVQAEKIDTLTKQVADLRKEKADDERLTRAADTSAPAAGLPEHRGVGTVVSEPRTYRKDNQGESSFMKDLFAQAFNPSDTGAMQRMARHQQEATVEGQISKRAASTSTFAGIIPPQYLIDDYALVARAGRPIANSVQHLDLPEEGMSFIIPRSTTGVAVGIQTAENAALSTTDEVWANLTVPVATAGAYNDVSRQALERAKGVDSIVFADLAAAYGVVVDQQVISGTGASGQALGILNTSGVNQASAFVAAATPTTFYSKVAGQLSAIETTRYLAPNVLYMSPRRWNWLIAQVDTAGRPLAVPNTNGPFNALAVSQSPIDTPSAEPVGFFQGLPVVTDASIPLSVGSGPEDQVIVARREDLWLWEDNSAPFTLRFEQTVGTNLTVRLVAYGYFAFTAGRFPTAVGVVGGNSAAGFGLIAPTF